MKEHEFRYQDHTQNPRRRELLENNIALLKQRLGKPEWKNDRQKLKYEIAMMEKELDGIIRFKA